MTRPKQTEPITTRDSGVVSAKAAAAEYIAVEMSRLARMASANDFQLLPYLIDMAVLEAWREASESGEGGSDGRGAEV